MMDPSQINVIQVNEPMKLIVPENIPVSVLSAERTTVSEMKSKKNRSIQPRVGSTRPEPNSFSLTLTNEQKADIVIKSIEMKNAATAIKSWMLSNHPDEYEKHEYYNDWKTCFLMRQQVERWVTRYQNAEKSRIPETSRFASSLTYEQEREVSLIAIQNKGEKKGGHYSLKAIQSWMKEHYYEQFQLHEKYNDWDNCILKQHKVRDWARKIEKTGIHRRRDHDEQIVSATELVIKGCNTVMALPSTSQVRTMLENSGQGASIADMDGEVKSEVICLEDLEMQHETARQMTSIGSSSVDIDIFEEDSDEEDNAFFVQVGVSYNLGSTIWSNRAAGRPLR